MKAADVMVRDVVTIRPDSGVQDAARLLLENRISGLPVVDDEGRLVGIVSEGDLMRRPEAGTEPRHSWWLELVTPNEALAREFTKTHARKVADVMTRAVITAAPETPLGEIARLLEKHRIKRVPVVQDGRVVGIVSRANLLQALASFAEAPSATAVEDSALREAVLSRLEAQPWARLALVNVIVRAGTVDLWGIVGSQAERTALRVAAEGTPGVRAVNDNLIVRPLAAGT
ncbi:MAG: CBS domain-containing protein [Variibacter sp.]|nr:CBS domain-containing protein [Variibacter sp.]